MKTQQIFTIQLSRLPAVDGTPGLVSLSIDENAGGGQPRRLGALTDVALRGRLAHYDLHGANEVAAIRRALLPDNGRFTVHEGWSGLNSCLRFWHDFMGSQIRLVEWTCDGCSAPNRVLVGASVGETFARACKCGHVKRITTAAHISLSA